MPQVLSGLATCVDVPWHTVSSTVGGGVMGPNRMPDLQNLLFVVVSHPFGGVDNFLIYIMIINYI